MNKLRAKLYEVIFGTDTRAGKLFDVVLLYVIVASVLVVMIESVPEYASNNPSFFLHAEWVFTILFTLEYVLRLYVSPRPLKYVFSIWGVIDLLSILPTYLSMILAGYHYLLIVRIFRLLRVFRILKLTRFTNEGHVLYNALRSSMYKISIFLSAVLAIVIILGTLMYVVEGGNNGFNSIPQSIYWAIVTITTVGYGDMVPLTVVGKFISSIAMIIGYAIIAVPTGIMTVEVAQSGKKATGKEIKCKKCNSVCDANANYCSNCGTAIDLLS